MDKKLLGLLAVFFLTFSVFISLMVFDKPLSKFTRAAENFQPSGQTSIVLAWPLSVKADGQSESTVSVFARNVNNKPIVNKPVLLNSTLGVVKEKEVFTDKQGTSTFHITSDTQGLAEISAIIDKTISVSQKVTVKFE